MRINERHLDRILANVQKPARYIGGEYNSVLKDWDDPQLKTKVALVFPDVYDLGMSNLGLAILYDLLNQRADILAERVYVPWPDMEAQMRVVDMPLYALESKRELRDFDLIGISLPYEQLYTNVLTMLNLAKMPLLSLERDSAYPLVCAGGNAVFNPEPMADFIDFFVMGEGEDVIIEVIQAMHEVEGQAREAQLSRLAQIPGVYVPRFYSFSYYEEDGTISNIEPLNEAAERHIVKRISPLMPPPVTKFIVPFVDVVFNRASIEIQRGCTRGCRFCQAGMVFRPVRERSLEELIDTVEQIMRDTGHEEIGLLSLSSSDYSQIGPLVQAISNKYGDRALNISLPSLRIESFSADLMEMLQGSRKASFTFAPEAATDRMREVINKYISTEDLLSTADEVFKRGWRLIKLYFMIGQPTETDADVIAIAELAKQVLQIGRKYHNNKAKVRVGVSTFVPKPHTPFQWAGLADLAGIRRKQALMREAFGNTRGIIFNWNNPEETLMEAFLSRGDRRLGPVIKSAWEKGAKFDAWNEWHRPDAWRAAFAEHELDPAWYAHRVRPADEIFPWDHINAGVEKRWLLMDWYAAEKGETKVDCREHCYHCGILSAFKGLRANTPPPAWKCPPIRNPRWQKMAEDGKVLYLTEVVKENMEKARVPDQ
ncbi:MAG TPA: TIGR03960 family B12-binding radical SAM protein [Anaerolineae bacterium]|nr:TIGR03960 family B12-binding radical SAM protein [Anaerolineae bacterium]HMR66267.1 TIGR03960 family B12-binding radical SAM protein [Anaerolineae bacterium]